MDEFDDLLAEEEVTLQDLYDLRELWIKSNQASTDLRNLLTQTYGADPNAQPKAATLQLLCIEAYTNLLGKRWKELMDQYLLDMEDRELINASVFNIEEWKPKPVKTTTKRRLSVVPNPSKLN